MTARVVRCEVSDLSGGTATTYKAGLCFDEALEPPFAWR